MSLRQAAQAAEISPAHLSDIEKGRSHASLPVLLRLCRIIRLPLGRLLPRLGGHRVLQSRVESVPGSVLKLSHPDLDLIVTNVNVVAGGEYRINAKPDEDVFAFVFAGSCQVDIDGERHTLKKHDALDVEQATSIRFRASQDCQLLLCRGNRR